MTPRVLTAKRRKRVMGFLSMAARRLARRTMAETSLMVEMTSFRTCKPCGKLMQQPRRVPHALSTGTSKLDHSWLPLAPLLLQYSEQAQAQVSAWTMHPVL